MQYVYLHQQSFVVRSSVFTTIVSTVMDSGNDGGTLGTTAGSDCFCCWHDMLAQKERYMCIHLL